MKRRAFLKSGGLALFGIGFGAPLLAMPRFLGWAAASSVTSKRKTIVCIFQRGAMDGLMAVTPFEDTFLKQGRPTLSVEMPAAGKDNSLIDLDGKFGLHPSMKAFEPLFREKKLAIVHGIGSPNSSRSHFDAQDYMESGTPFSKGTSSGWLNRAVGLSRAPSNPFTAVSLTSATPRSFYGEQPSISISNLSDFGIQLKGNQMGATVAAKSFEDLYDQTTSGLVKQAGQESFDAIKIIKQTDFKKYTPSSGAIYPGSPLGNSLKQIAQLIKMNVGLEVAFAESNGWDTHFNQGIEKGVFARSAADLAGAIAAFWTDIAPYQDDVSLMTMTEFGRTVRQNGTGGTDHGRGSCNFLLGNDVNGGLVHGLVKTLSPENLEDGRDLPVTTDFRSVFSEFADRHLGLHNDHVLFPDWNGKPIGVMKS